MTTGAGAGALQRYPHACACKLMGQRQKHDVSSPPTTHRRQQSMTFPSRFQNSSIGKSFWLPDRRLCGPAHAAAGPSSRGHSEDRAQPHAPMPSRRSPPTLLGHRFRTEGRGAVPPCANHSPQVSNNRTRGKLSPVTSFLGQRKGEETIFRMVIMKQTPISVNSRSGTVRASKRINLFDPDHSLKELHHLPALLTSKHNLQTASWLVPGPTVSKKGVQDATPDPWVSQGLLPRSCQHRSLRESLCEE